jgi:hypothetical protein
MQWFESILMLAEHAPTQTERIHWSGKAFFRQPKFFWIEFEAIKMENAGVGKVLLGKSYYFDISGLPTKYKVWNEERETVMEECLELYCDCIDQTTDQVMAFLICCARMKFNKQMAQLIAHLVWDNRYHPDKINEKKSPVILLMLTNSLLSATPAHS